MFMMKGDDLKPGPSLLLLVTWKLYYRAKVQGGVLWLSLAVVWNKQNSTDVSTSGLESQWPSLADISVLLCLSQSVGWPVHVSS